MSCYDFIAFTQGRMCNLLFFIVCFEKSYDIKATTHNKQRNNLQSWVVKLTYIAAREYDINGFKKRKNKEKKRIKEKENGK